MADPFLGEIRICSFDFAPRGWAMCNGQFLPINQNQGLFSLMGTSYGGNGQTTFALPDLRGRTPLHMGAGYTQGQRGGEEFHTLNINELPAHTHQVQGRNALATTGVAAGNAIGNKGRLGRDILGEPASLVSMHSSSVTSTGGSQAHNNLQPYLVLNFVVALQGIFPSQT